MTNQIDVRDVCCVALELSKTSWVCAFAPPVALSQKEPHSKSDRNRRACRASGEAVGERED